MATLGNKVVLFVQLNLVCIFDQLWYQTDQSSQMNGSIIFLNHASNILHLSAQTLNLTTFKIKIFCIKILEMNNAEICEILKNTIINRKLCHHESVAKLS